MYFVGKKNNKQRELTLLISVRPHTTSPVCVPDLGCFRELCALCWMLHVRDKLSSSCRQYQKARENVEGKKVLTWQKSKKNEQALLAKLLVDRFYCSEHIFF